MFEYQSSSGIEALGAQQQNQIVLPDLLQKRRYGTAERGPELERAAVGAGPEFVDEGILFRRLHPVAPVGDILARSDHQMRPMRRDALGKRRGEPHVDLGPPHAADAEQDTQAPAVRDVPDGLEHGLEAAGVSHRVVDDQASSKEGTPGGAPTRLVRLLGGTAVQLPAAGLTMVTRSGDAIVALDAKTGTALWVHDGLNGMTTRGMNYWESADRTDRRLLFINRGHLTAIDARNGRTVRSFCLYGETTGHISAASMQSNAASVKLLEFEGRLGIS